MAEDERLRDAEIWRARASIGQEDPGAWAQSFLASGIAGMGELIGISPSPQVEAWRQKHPLGGLTSELLGPVGYYTGAAKVGRSMLAGSKLLSRIDAIAEGTRYPTVVRRALGEMAAIAPAEGVRLGVTGALGNDLWEVGADVAVGAALTGVLGAGIGALESAGKRTLQKWNRPAADATWPEQLQLRELAPKVEAGQIADVDNAKRLMEEWRSTIRKERAGREGMPGIQVLDRKKIAERIPLGRRKVQSYIRDELEGSGDAVQLNRAFFVRSGVAKPGARMFSAPLAVAGRGRAGFQGLESAEELADVELRTGLLPNWEAWAQFPTYRAIRHPKIAAKFEEKIVRENMKPIGDGWWIARERGKAGMYVLGKKLPGKPAAGDEWFFAKTDSPGFFTPKAGSLARTTDTANAFWRRVDEFAEAGQSSPVFNATKTLVDQTPLTLYEGAPGTSLAAKGGAGAVKVLGKLFDVGDTSQARDALGAFGRAFFAPTAWQFTKHPAAQRLWHIRRAAFEMAEAKATRLVYGEAKLDPTKAPWLQLLRSPRSDDSIAAMVDGLDGKDLSDLGKVLFRGGGLQTAGQLNASPRLTKLLQTLQNEDTREITALQKLQDLTGDKRVRAHPEHFWMSRSWKGEHRAPLYEGDTVVALGSGYNRKQAQDEARWLVGELRKQGRNVSYRDEVFQFDKRDDLRFLSRLTTSRPVLRMVGALREEYAMRNAGRPGFFHERRGMGGATGEFRPFTKEEVLDTVNKHVHQLAKYEAELSVNHLTFNDMANLSVENPGMHAQLLQRTDDLVGKQGPTATLVNRWVDTALGDFVGKNSATRLVRSVNSFMHHTAFGFFNIAHAGLQIGQFLQTGLPELAFIRGGHTERLGNFYQTFLRAGPDGLPRELLSTISPIKTAAEGLRLLRQPDAEFIEALSKARNDGIINPRISEAWVGPEATVGTGFRKALQEGGLGRLLLKIGSLPVEKADELARAHAFATGWAVGRRLLMRDPGEAFQFARDFTHRTMYGYAVSDRARVFTGPFGSALGLFKNWQMHYIMQMVDYASLGASRGDWAPLLWGVTGSAVLGGLPATGGLYWAANYFAKDVFGKQIDELWYEQWPRGQSGPNVSDAVFMGVPGFLPTLAGLPGFSLTSATAMPGGNPARDISQLMSFVYYDRMKYLGRAVGEAYEQGDATGHNPLRDEGVRANLARALAPRALYRVMQQTEDGVIRASGSLYPQVDGLSAGEQALYSLGFNPHKLELAYRVNDRLWNSAEEKKVLTSALGQALAGAQQARDFQEMGRLQTRLMYLGVDPDSVMASARAYGQKYREDMIERQGDKKAVAWYQRLGLVGQ